MNYMPLFFDGNGQRLMLGDRVVTPEPCWRKGLVTGYVSALHHAPEGGQRRVSVTYESGVVTRYRQDDGSAFAMFDDDEVFRL